MQDKLQKTGKIEGSCCDNRPETPVIDEEEEDKINNFIT